MTPIKNTELFYLSMNAFTLAITIYLFYLTTEQEANLLNMSDGIFCRESGCCLTRSTMVSGFN